MESLFSFFNLVIKKHSKFKKISEGYVEDLFSFFKLYALKDIVKF